ncbi:MAG: hypothetical protein ONA90_04600 [candidate division KSB1 bacterium]|nr:hypothetical protein [candidate division KSB1 bacterium]
MNLRRLMAVLWMLVLAWGLMLGGCQKKEEAATQEQPAATEEQPAADTAAAAEEQPNQ